MTVTGAASVKGCGQRRDTCMRRLCRVRVAVKWQWKAGGRPGPTDYGFKLKLVAAKERAYESIPSDNRASPCVVPWSARGVGAMYVGNDRGGGWNASGRTEAR